MKVLILNYEYPPLGGGAGVVSRYQADGLAELGHQVTVVTAWFEGEKEIEEKDNLTIIRLKSKRRYKHKTSTLEKVSWYLKAKKFLLVYCREHKFDLAFAHYAIPSGAFCPLLKKKFDLPYIVVSHGHDVPWVYPRVMFKFHFLTYFWLKRIFGESKFNILLSSQMKEKCDRFLGQKLAEKNLVIPNGCDADFFFPAIEKKSKIFKIIFVGRLTDQKKPFVFLKALKILADKKLNFTAEIIGDGPLKNKMEKFVADVGLTDKVNFLGWVSKDRIREEYQSASLQVVSSSFEAMSIAALESLFCGQYIISTPVSGNTDVITTGVNGDLYGFGDYHALAYKIESYYLNQYQKNDQIDSNVLNDFRSKYCWNNIINDYNELF